MKCLFCLSSPIRSRFVALRVRRTARMGDTTAKPYLELLVSLVLDVVKLLNKSVDLVVDAPAIAASLFGYRMELSIEDIALG